MTTTLPIYRDFRFSTEVIANAVPLYDCFSLNLCDVARNQDDTLRTVNTLTRVRRAEHR